MNVALPLNNLFSEKCNSLKWPSEHIAVSLYSEPQMKSIEVILSTFWINYQRGRKGKRDLRLGGEKNKQHINVGSKLCIICIYSARRLICCHSY